MSDDIDSVLAKARAKLEDHEREVRDTKKLINQLLSFAGRPPQYNDIDIMPKVAGAALLGDEYVGKSQNTACREILERRKALNLGPASSDELYSELREGGYIFEAKTDDIAKRGLVQMLTKNSAVFFRLSNGKYGLLAWYPGAKNKAAPTPKKPVPDEVPFGEEEQEEEQEFNPDEILDLPVPDVKGPLEEKGKKGGTK